ncbi:MAG: isochorismatase family protein [Planctomycetes bacterium]|nr:isochorismatase family protein [Planctomycetota bacterium]
MSTESLRSPELLHRAASRLLIVDVQDKLVPTLTEETRSRLIRSCHFLAEGAQLLGIPTSITEQYPQGLGATVATLQPFCADRPAKKRFSAVEALGWPLAADADDDRFQIVVAGMETHVCILQTVLNLLSCGYQVYVVVDAVASRREIDQRTAIERMAYSGATLVTAEGVLFEWAETAEAAEFKQLSGLVKGRGI